MKITILSGGPSSERDISLESGRAVAAACERLGHDVFTSDIGPDNLAGLDHPCDVVFPVLHGPYGEDGTVQALLESRGIPYVGSDSAASRACMDKHESKKRWRDAGLPTAEWMTIRRDLPRPSDLIVPPAVLKPVCEGSSVGVVFCETQEELDHAIERALTRFDRIVVEKRLVGRELTVGILGSRVLPLVEVQPTNAFYDFEAKYLRDDTRYIVDPPMDAATRERIQDLAMTAYRLLGCRHYGRVDVILDRRDGPQLLEINTIPGFTPHSLLPKAAAHVGIPFDQLVQRLLELATTP